MRVSIGFTALDVMLITLSQLVSILTVCHRWQKELPTYEQFFKDVHKRIEEETGKADKCLAGLEPGRAVRPPTPGFEWMYPTPRKDTNRSTT
jgi:hypothetical protein